MNSIPIPPGLCQCGCGGRTPLAARNKPERQQIKGQPCRFMPGHAAYTPRAPEPCSEGLRLPLTRGESCLIDPLDADLAQERYHRDRVGYAMHMLRQNGRRQRVYLHRLILARIIGRPLTPQDECDHINGDKLDNRRANLRLATHQQNGWNRKTLATNTTGYTGVTRVVTKSGIVRWVARISLGKRDRHLGRFSSPEAASAAYEAAALAAHGEWHRPAAQKGTGDNGRS